MDSFHWLLIAIFFRSLGAVSVLPFGEHLSWLPRLIIAAGFTALTFQKTFTNTLTGSGSGAAILIEFCIGVIVAAPLLIVVEGLRMGGELLDSARGQTIGSILDPLGDHGGSDLAAIGRLGSTAVALYSGGLEVIISSFLKSFTLIAPGGAASSVTESITAIADGSLCSTVMIGTTLLQMILPWVLGFFAIDLLCGVCGSFVSAFNLQNLAATLKLILLSVLLLGIAAGGGQSPGEWILNLVSGANMMTLDLQPTANIQEAGGPALPLDPAAIKAVSGERRSGKSSGK